MPSAKKIDIRILLAFAAIYIIWGTTYFAVLIGIKTIPPFIMGAIRYSIAGTAFLLYAVFNKENIFKSSVLKNILIGAIMQTGGQAILFWSEKYISSGFTAILVSTEPIWFIILDKPQWKYYFSNKLILTGIAAGFIGIIVLFENMLGGSLHMQQSIQLIASLITLLSAILWAGGSLYFKYHHTQGSLQLNLGWQLIGGVFACMLVSLFTHEWFNFTLNKISGQSWLAVFYLAVAGSIVAFSCYNWLLKKRPAAIVGTYAYINPVIAVVVGSLLASEQIFINQVIGMVIILFSAYLINKSGTQSTSV